MGLRNWLERIGFPILDRKAIAGLLLFWILVFSVGGCLLIGMAQRLSPEYNEQLGLLPRTATETMTREFSETDSDTLPTLLSTPVFVPGELTGLPLTRTVEEWVYQNPPTQTPLFFTQQPAPLSTMTRVPTATWVIYRFTQIIPTSYYRTSTPRPTSTPTVTVTRTITPTVTTVVPTTHIPTTAVASVTSTPTQTITGTGTTTPTSTETPTPTATDTATPTPTSTDTQTVTPTITVISKIIAFSADFNDPITGQDNALDLLHFNEESNSVQKILVDSDHALFGDWSPDGTKIVFEVTRDNLVRLFTVSADGSAKSEVANQPEGQNSQPQWSPNGKWIVHVNTHPDRDSASENLWITPADGSAAFELTGGAFKDTQPSWSSDGKTIVFVRGTELYKLDVQELDEESEVTPQSLLNSFLNLFSDTKAAANAVTTTPQPLFDDKSVQGDWPRFSPNDQYLLLVRGGDIIRLELSSKNELNLTGETAGMARTPSWSPDGKRIVFVVHTEGDSARDEIWIVSSTGDTRDQLVLPSELVEKRRPVWKP
jgi:Tol biopolymer transport system component